MTVLEATGLSFEWRPVDAGESQIAIHGTPLPELCSTRSARPRWRSRGRSRRPSASGFRSVNVTLRQALDLYANLRPARSMKGVETRYENVDLVIVRENTEDLYAGIEHMVGLDAAESIKIITRFASERIARFAFDYAVANGRHKVTAVHKANIMKLSDGLFLESCRTVAEDYAGKIEFEDRIVDNMCMQLVPEAGPVRRARAAQPVRRHHQRPVRRPGRWPGRRARAPTSATKAAVFEPVHGSAPKYAGQGRGQSDGPDPLGDADAPPSGRDVLPQRPSRPPSARSSREGRTVPRDLGGTAGTKASRRQSPSVSQPSSPRASRFN